MRTMNRMIRFLIFLCDGIFGALFLIGLLAEAAILTEDFENEYSINTDTLFRKDQESLW